MGPEEKAALGDELRAVHRVEDYQASYSSGLVMSDRTLGQISRAISRGLAALFSERLDNEWNIQPPRKVSLHRQSPLPSKSTRFQSYYQWSEAAAILWGVRELLLKCQLVLATCKGCRAPFVRVRKQTFCGEPCAQAECNAKKKRLRASSG